MNRISVIIPNYNRAKLIGETLENILSQTLEPHEVIVVDDGSTDNSLDVIRSFGSRITLISQSNQGPGLARNNGLKVASGDYIQFFDSDDLCSLNKLECQGKTLEASGSDIVYSPWAKVYIEDPKRVRFENHVIQQRKLPDSSSSLTWFLRGWSIIFQSCMFKHSFVKKVGTYRTDLMPSEDSEFLFRMLLHQPKIEFVPECLVLYRLHTMGQITGTGTTKIHRLEDSTKFRLLMEEQMRKNQIKVDPLTYMIFQASIWQHLRNLQKISSEAYSDFMKKPQYNPSIFIQGLYRTINFLRIVESGLRLRLTGSRYSGPYQAFYPTEQQRQLIRDMGYSLISE